MGRLTTAEIKKARAEAEAKRRQAQTSGGTYVSGPVEVDEPGSDKTVPPKTQGSTTVVSGGRERRAANKAPARGGQGTSGMYNSDGNYVGPTVGSFGTIRRHGRGTYQTDFVNGAAISPGNLYESGLKQREASHQSSIREMQRSDEIAQAQRDRLAARNARIEGALQRGRKQRADRAFENADFNDVAGWKNLGRTTHVDKDGNEISLGRGASGVRDHDARLAKLLDLGAKLLDAMGDGKLGNITGRRKDLQRLLDVVGTTNDEGGLTEKQLVGLESKLKTMRKELGDKAEFVDRQTGYYAKRDMDRKRREIGDSAGILTDDAVAKQYDRKRWQTISDTLSGIGKDPENYFQNLDTLSKNGVNVREVARIAINQNPDLAVKYGDAKDKDAFLEQVGLDQLRKSTRTPEGMQALDTALKDIRNVDGRPKKGSNVSLLNDILGADVTGANGEIVHTDVKSPQNAAADAANATASKGYDVYGGLQQPGPTTVRATSTTAENAQKTINEAAGYTPENPTIIVPPTKGNAGLQTVTPQPFTDATAGRFTAEKTGLGLNGYMPTQVIPANPHSGTAQTPEAQTPMAQTPEAQTPATPIPAGSSSGTAQDDEDNRRGGPILWTR